MPPRMPQPRTRNKPDADKPADPPVASQRVALGSSDPASPYRMLVYLLNDGAAIERLEMNSPQYRNLENRSGYLGYLAPIDSKGRLGVEVRVVGPGTPAAAAGSSPATSSRRSPIAASRPRPDLNSALERNRAGPDDSGRGAARRRGGGTQGATDSRTAGGHPSGARRRRAWKASSRGTTTRCRS